MRDFLLEVYPRFCDSVYDLELGLRAHYLNQHLKPQIDVWSSNQCLVAQINIWELRSTLGAQIYYETSINVRKLKMAPGSSKRRLGAQHLRLGLAM